MKKLIFLAMITLSTDVLGAQTAAGAGATECGRNPDGSIRRAIVISLGSTGPTDSAAAGAGGAEPLAPPPGMFSGVTAPVAMRIAEYLRAMGNVSGSEALEEVAASLPATMGSEASSKAGRPIRTEKTFDYFEDVLTTAYWSFNPGNKGFTDEQKMDIGENFAARRKEIITFLKSNTNVLTLNRLISFDMPSVAAGIMERALLHDKTRLEVVDLRGSTVERAGLDVLFTALVNRGIGDDWAKQKKDGQNWLKGLKIFLPDARFAEEYDPDCITFAKENGITFSFAPYLAAK